MYYHKLRIPTKDLWRLLTLATLMLMVYQQGPGLIHRMHRAEVSEEQIHAWQFMHALILTSPNSYPKSLAVCEVWLSVHGVETPSEKGMKGLEEKWADIFSYWQGY